MTNSHPWIDLSEHNAKALVDPNTKSAVFSSENGFTEKQQTLFLKLGFTKKLLNDSVVFTKSDVLQLSEAQKVFPKLKKIKIRKDELLSIKISGSLTEYKSEEPEKTLNENDLDFLNSLKDKDEDIGGEVVANVISTNVDIDQTTVANSTTEDTPDTADTPDDTKEMDEYLKDNFESFLISEEFPLCIRTDFTGAYDEICTLISEGKIDVDKDFTRSPSEFRAIYKNLTNNESLAKQKVCDRVFPLIKEYWALSMKDIDRLKIEAKDKISKVEVLNNKFEELVLEYAERTSIFKEKNPLKELELPVSTAGLKSVIRFITSDDVNDELENMLEKERFSIMKDAQFRIFRYKALFKLRSDETFKNSVGDFYSDLMATQPTSLKTNCL
jgi:hypothetical protein